jgi:glycosyltransferase involved in cell wall biosynthesis
MRVLIVNDNPVEFYEARYYTSYTWPIFAAKLADYFDVATLWIPLLKVPDGSSVRGDLFEPGRLQIVGSHYYDGFFGYYSAYLANYRQINRQSQALANEHDIALIRIPSPIAPLIVKHCRRLRKPYALIVAGDISTSANMLLLSRGIKRALIKLIIKTVKNQELRLARHASVVYAYGEELADQFRSFCPRVKVSRDANVSLTEIFPREDTCSGNTIKLLRVGWLGPCKGLEYLFGAARLLRDRDLPIYLKIVGKEIDPEYTSNLKDMVQELDIGEFVEFAGPVSYGEIFKLYQESDIQVISSTSEGIPRVILEGAVNGLPLVSTSAGGCSSAVRDGEDGILVPPRDPAALANAIEQVIKVGSLRRRIIQGGFEMVKRYSSEAVCSEIAEDLSKAVETFPR